MTLATSTAAVSVIAPFKLLPFREPEIFVRRSQSGAVYIASRMAPALAPRSIPHLLDERAMQHPQRAWLKQRPPGGGPWVEISYSAAAAVTWKVARGLLELGIRADRGVMILSGNSIEHALVAMAAQRIGAPVTPVSVAYSTASRDHAKLRHCFDAVRPKAIFVQSVSDFSAALASLPLDDVVVISPEGGGGSLSLKSLSESRESGDVTQAMASLNAATVAKVLFTSGSTGMPKPTPQTQGALTAQIGALRAITDWTRVPDPGVIEVLDWMPWSHIAGGNVGFHRCLEFGGTFFIDEGRPAPGLFKVTMDNLREVRPQYFGSAPIAYAILAEAMEADSDFRDAVFSRMLYFLYGGATLSDDLYERLQALSVAATGMRTPVLTTYGATETQGITMTHWAIERVGMIGLPLPGTTIKLAPVGDKLEVRVKGASVMSGYLNMPEVTHAAFDDEGYYRLGDAARFEDPQRPEKGLVFDGRVAEDFKLSSGTWVSVGTLRPALVAACAPFVQDAVICGQDKPYVAALLWPSQAVVHKAVLKHNGDRSAAFEDLERRIAYCVTAFNAEQGGSSSKIVRFALLDTPPSLDDGEITDKGYVNQGRAQIVRAQAVQKLFAERK